VQPGNIEDKIRDYFLGRLSEAEAERFEEELALDHGLFSDAERVERELIDDYHRQSLSESDRGAFETNYLVTDARRHRLFINEGLWQIAGESAVPKEGFLSSLPGWWNWKIGLAVAAGAAIVLMLFTVGIPIFVDFGSVETTKVADQQNGFGITVLDESNRVVFNAGSVAVPSPAVSQTRDNTITVVIPIPTPTPGQAPRGIASFTLVPGALRDEGEQSIELAPATSVVEIKLATSGGLPSYRSYSATLKTADGETVLSIPRLRSLRFRTKSSRLENRTYVLYLEGRDPQGRLEPVAEYTFRVRR
jgi:hypothetical protein